MLYPSALMTLDATAVDSFFDTDTPHELSSIMVIKGNRHNPAIFNVS